MAISIRRLVILLLLYLSTSYSIMCEPTMDDFLASLQDIETKLFQLQDTISTFKQRISDLEEQLHESNTSLEVSAQELKKQATLLENLSQQLEQSKKRLELATEEYEAKISIIRKEHIAELRSEKRKRLLFQLLSGALGSVAVGGVLYGISR
jgi:septal ring factor EnvC (AmiA/AmiB activator)